MLLLLIITVHILIFVLFLLKLLLMLLLEELLLLVLLEKQLLLLLLGNACATLRWEAAREVGGRHVQPVVVLSTEQELLLLIGQVGIGVAACLSQNVHVALQLTNLSEVTHESLGDLLNEERLVGYVKENAFLLLSIGALQQSVLLTRTSQRFLFALLKLSGVAHQSR